MAEESLGRPGDDDSLKGDTQHGPVDQEKDMVCVCVWGGQYLEKSTRGPEFC